MWTSTECLRKAGIASTSSLSKSDSTDMQDTSSISLIGSHPSTKPSRQQLRTCLKQLWNRVFLRVKPVSRHTCFASHVREQHSSKIGGCAASCSGFAAVPTLPLESAALA